MSPSVEYVPQILIQHVSIETAPARLYDNSVHKHSLTRLCSGCIFVNSENVILAIIGGK